MTDAQRRMLRMVERHPGTELGEIVMEHARGSFSVNPLSWRNSDRVAGALLARGWMAVDGYMCQLTDAGREALKGEQ